MFGMAKEGVYVDDNFTGVDPSLIHRFYGVEGRKVTRPRGRTGAGHDGVDNVLDARIAEDQAENVLHEAVYVPTYPNPFTSQAGFAKFEQVLAEVQQEGVVPQIVASTVYKPMEELKVGKRVVKISLPPSVWRPRLIQWCQAVQVMSGVLALE